LSPASYKPEIHEKAEAYGQYQYDYQCGYYYGISLPAKQNPPFKRDAIKQQV
jgi:hypothetical protein